MYTQTLTAGEREAIDWVGGRYSNGDDLADLLMRCGRDGEAEWDDDCDITFRIPELRAYPQHSEIPVLEPEPRMLLHGLTIREYSLSPDGRFLTIILPNKHNLQIFSF